MCEGDEATPGYERGTGWRVLAFCGFCSFAEKPSEPKSIKIFKFERKTINFFHKWTKHNINGGIVHAEENL